MHYNQQVTQIFILLTLFCSDVSVSHKKNNQESMLYVSLLFTSRFVAISVEWNQGVLPVLPIVCSVNV